MPKLKKDRKRLIKNSFFLRNLLKNSGFNIGNSQTNIIPIIIGDPKKTILLSKKLEKKGFYVVAIRPPTVLPNSSRLRISVSSFHTKKDIGDLFNSLKILINEI